jgi:hypothetical protein
MPDIVGAALREWGSRHELADGELEEVTAVEGVSCYQWRVKSRFGSLTIRFTELLTKRGLEPALVEELDKHLVGRHARKGHWNVTVLTNGPEVSVRLREEVSLDSVSPEDQAWLR